MKTGLNGNLCSINTKLIYRTNISPVHKLICDCTKRESYKMYETIRKDQTTVIHLDIFRPGPNSFMPTGEVA